MYINVAGKAQPLFNKFNQVDSNAHAKEKALANPLFSWHVSYFVYKRQKNVVFLNDASTFAVTVYDINAKNKSELQARFEENLAVVWKNLGLSEKLLKQYLQVAGPWQVNKSINRSAVGSVALLCREVGESLITHLDEQMMSIEMTKRMRRLGRKYIHTNETIEVFKTAVPFKWQPVAAPEKEVDRKDLREIIRRLRKDAQTNLDELTPDQFDNLIRGVQQTNDKLIATFIDAERTSHSAKTIRQYKNSLSFYLNQWLAYHFQTILDIESTAIADLLYHGSTENEVKLIRQAMKKLLKFLYDNKVVTAEWYTDRKTLLNQENLSADKLASHSEDDDSWSQMDALMFNDSGDPTLETIFDKTTDKMIDDYLTAFASLYGLIPVHQAYQIIKAQNPTLPITADKFQTYVEERVGNRNLRYLVFNLAEMAAEIKLNTTFENENFIVYPTIIADSKRLINLYDHQLGLQYYVPAKEKLLRFKEDGFFDIGELQTRLENLFMTHYELTGSNFYAAVYLSLFGLKLDQYEDLDLSGMTRAIKKVSFMLNNSIHLGIDKTTDHEQLIKLFFLIESNIRRPYDRGWTSSEMIKLPTLMQLVNGPAPFLTDEVITKIHDGVIDRRELLSLIESSDNFSPTEKEELRNKINEI